MMGLARLTCSVGVVKYVRGVRNGRGAAGGTPGVWKRYVRIELSFPTATRLVVLLMRNVPGEEPSVATVVGRAGLATL